MVQMRLYRRHALLDHIFLHRNQNRFLIAARALQALFILHHILQIHLDLDLDLDLDLPFFSRAFHMYHVTPAQMVNMLARINYLASRVHLDINVLVEYKQSVQRARILLQERRCVHPTLQGRILVLEQALI